LPTTSRQFWTPSFGAGIRSKVMIKKLVSSPRARRISAIVKRSAPDTSRPRLPDEMEKELECVDRDSAACYANLEDLSSRFADLAADLRSENNAEAEPIPVEIIRDEPSIANKAIELRQASASRRMDTDTIHFADEMKEAK